METSRARVPEIVSALAAVYALWAAVLARKMADHAADVLRHFGAWLR